MPGVVREARDGVGLAIDSTIDRCERRSRARRMLPMLPREPPTTAAMTDTRHAPRHRLIALAAATTLVATFACASGQGASVYDVANQAADATTSCRGTSERRDPVGVTNTPVRIGEEVARAEICAMMDRGAASWNRGDLTTFMDDYVDSATYVGSRGLLHGRTQIAAHYAPRFAVGATRDSLSFRGLEVRLVAEELAQVVATYVLTRGDSVTAMGPTSLLMRRVDGRWRILHDHSS